MNLLSYEKISKVGKLRVNKITEFGFDNPLTVLIRLGAVGAYYVRSLSKDVFERCTSTGKGLYAFLGSSFALIFV